MGRVAVTEPKALDPAVPFVAALPAAPAPPATRATQPGPEAGALAAPPLLASLTTELDLSLGEHCRRLAFLAEAGLALGESLEPGAILQCLTRLVVPRYAGWCMALLVHGGPSASCFAVAHVDAEKEALAGSLVGQLSLGEDGLFGIGRALATGHGVLEPLGACALAASPDRQAEPSMLALSLGVGSYVTVPLVAAGRTLGALTLVGRAGGPAYGPADLDLAAALARQASQALRHAVRAAEIEQALRTCDESLSYIAHDLRAPLATIKGYAQFLREQVVAADPPGAQRYADRLAKIDTIATKMAAAVDELLDVTSAQLGRAPELTPEPVELVTLVREAIAAHQPRAEHHRLRLETAELCLVGLWDRRRVERVLDNLLGNAIKYSPGGGAVTVLLRREEVASGPWAVLAVQDQGVGIPPHDLPRVFERFYRARNVVGRVPGTGIGLAGAAQIVEQHGGSITAESREGQGSTFTVRLPLFPSTWSGAGETASDSAVDAALLASLAAHTLARRAA